MDLQSQLSRRERQIMDIIYTHVEATISDVLKELPDPPARGALGRLISILENKGHLKHYQKGREFIFQPTVPRQQAGPSAMRRVVDTFFCGSLRQAIAAHLVCWIAAASTTSASAPATQPTPAGPDTGPATAKSAMIWCPYGTGKLTFFEDVPLWSDQPGSATLGLTGAPAFSWANIRFERKQGRILATLKSKGEPTWYPVRHMTVQLFNSKKSPLASDTQVLSTVESAVKSSHHVVDITLHFNLGEADKIPEPAFYSVSASAVEDGSAAKATPQPSTTSSPAGSGSTFSAANGASTQPAEMVITPGVGVGPITLGMSKEDVIRHLGKPDKIEGEGGYGLNYISSMGLSVLVSRSKGVVSISCWTPGATYWLQGMFVKDFRGATEKGIKMGAGRDDIVRAYGKADSESGDASLRYMDYRSQGIQFMLRYGKLAKIDVLEPDVFALIPAKAFSQPAATTHPSTQPATQPGG